MSATETTYKTSLINNRRYLGNKYKLLSFITCVVNDEGEIKYEKTSYYRFG